MVRRRFQARAITKHLKPHLLGEAVRKKQKLLQADQAKQPKSDKAVKSANGHTDHAKTPPRKKVKPSPKDLPPLGDDFAVLDLPRPLNHAIQTLGFETCTPVQKSVYPTA